MAAGALALLLTVLMPGQVVLNWTGGDLVATLSVTTVSGPDTLNITTTADHDFYALTVVSSGTVNWSNGSLRSGGGGSFLNAGAFNDLNPGGYSISNPFGGTFIFTNNGTYTRNAAGTTYLSATFNNNGALLLQQGDLQFGGGGTMSSAGSLLAAAGTHVYFTNDYAVADGASLTGSGSYLLTGGTFTIGGNTSLSSFSQTGGTLAGTQTLKGNLSWSGGTWSDPGTTTLGAATVLTLSNANDAYRDFYQHTIVNLGTVNWNSGNLRSGSGGAFTNAGTFNDLNTSGYAIENPFGGIFTFTNNGTYTRNALGTTYFYTTFNNNGPLLLQQGDLQFNGGGTMSSAGSIAAAVGTHVYFTNDYAVADGASLTGSGSYLLTGGTFTVGGNATLSSFSQTGGTLAGTQTLKGSLSWSGGTWSNPGTTTLAATSVLNLSNANDAYRDFYQRTIVNLGTVNWNGGNLRSGSGGAFTNAGTFNDLNAGGYSVENPFGGTFLFTNNGTYIRNAAGTTYLYTTFNNNGPLLLPQGDLQFNGGGTMSSAGSLTAAAGTHVYFTNDYTVANGASLTGNGSYLLTGGTFTVGGNATLSSFSQTGGTFAGTQTLAGTLSWSGGTWSDPGTTTLAAATVLTLSAATDAYRDFYLRTIVNFGTVNWNGGNLRSGGGGAFTNAGTFNDLNAAGYSMNNPFGGTFTFTNNGTYIRNAAGTTYVYAPFNNNGPLLLQQGDLQFSGGGGMSSTGSILAAAGTHVYFTNDYAVANGASLTGSGSYLLTGGTFNVSGSIALSNFAQTGGTVAGTQTVFGNFNWSGGNWDAAATTTLAATTVLNLSDATDAYRDFTQRAIINLGTVNWNGGYLRSGSGGSFTNAGTFNDLSTAGYAITNPFGGTFTFTNSGTYVRNAAGTSTISVPFVNNQGTVLVSAGLLHFTNSFTQTGGTVAVSNGATAQFDQGLNLAAGTLTGTGTIAATVTTQGRILPGDLSVTGDLTLASLASLDFGLRGTTRGTTYDTLRVGGAATLGGTLGFVFQNGFGTAVAPTDSFTLLSAASPLTGAFTNVSSGSVLVDDSGIGALTVYYGAGSPFGADNLVLTNFSPVPEPATWALLLLGAGAAGIYSRKLPSARR